MTEVEWVELMAKRVRAAPMFKNSRLEIKTGFRLAYGFEISAHKQGDENEPVPKTTYFETDLAIIEREEDDSWQPRVIVEAKITSGL